MSEGWILAKKPDWVIEKERRRHTEDGRPFWLFGLHAVEAALKNPARQVSRLILTQNAHDKLLAAVRTRGIAPELVDARKFPSVLDPQSVHQGAAMEVLPLRWPSLDELLQRGEGRQVVLLLDRVTDPHNVGAILRSAEVFGASAVVAPQRAAAPETGSLAKSASGALERQPYLRVKNLARSMEDLVSRGVYLIGLDGAAEEDLGTVVRNCGDRPLGIVLGAEGPGLREKTRDTCHTLARIPAQTDFASLNVSNAAAVALFAARHF